MFFRQSVLFTVTLLWNQTKSALDNRNKTDAVAFDHSSLPRPNENPLDSQTLLKLQESATVNVTNHVDQEDEARLTIAPRVENLRSSLAMSAANMVVTKNIPPALAFRVLRVGKGRADLTTDESLPTLISYASKYKAPKASRGQKRWYTPEKVFLLLVKTRSVDKVLDLFEAAGLFADKRKLKSLLYQDGFSKLREAMNEQWLAARTEPGVVYGFMGLFKVDTPQPLDLYHWVLYCHLFKQEYGGKASASATLAKSLRSTVIDSSLLLFSERFPFASYDPNYELKYLVNSIQLALYDRLIEDKLTPIDAYRYLRWSLHTDVLVRKSDKGALAVVLADELRDKNRKEGFRALEAYTVAYLTKRKYSFKDAQANAHKIFSKKNPENIRSDLELISRAD